MLKNFLKKCVTLKHNEDDDILRAHSVFQICKFYHCAVRVTMQQCLLVYKNPTTDTGGSNLALTQDYH